MFGLRVLSFASLLGYLQAVIGRIKDPRQSSNGTKYTVKDAMLSAFSAFFLQCESFLARSAEAPHSLLGVWDECAGVGRDGN